MIKGKAIIESGLGSVEGMCGCTDDGLGVILLRSHTPCKIGVIEDDWDGSDAEVEWYFGNVESLESVIDLMTHLRDSMVKVKEESE